MTQQDEDRKAKLGRIIQYPNGQAVNSDLKRKEDKQRLVGENPTDVVDVDELMKRFEKNTGKMAKASNKSFVEIDVDEFIMLAQKSPVPVGSSPTTAAAATTTTTATTADNTPAENSAPGALPGQLVQQFSLPMPLPGLNRVAAPPANINVGPGAYPLRGPGHADEESDIFSTQFRDGSAPWRGMDSNPFSDHVQPGLHQSQDLVRATPVDEPSRPFDAQEATQIGDSEMRERIRRTEERKAQTKKQLGLAAVIGLLLIAGVIVLVLVTSSDATDSNKGTTIDTVAASNASDSDGNLGNGTMAIAKKDDIDVYPLIRPFLANSTRHIIEQGQAQASNSNSSAPQFQAYQWLQADPWKQNYTVERLVQRFALATLYYSTNGDTWQNNGVGGYQESSYREFGTPRIEAQLAGPPPRPPRPNGGPNSVGPPPDRPGGSPPDRPDGSGPPPNGSGGGPPPNAAGGSPPPNGGGGGGLPPSGSGGGPPPNGSGGPPPASENGGSGPPPDMPPPPSDNGGIRKRSRMLQDTIDRTLNITSEKWLSYNTSECLWWTRTPFRFQKLCNDEDVFQYLDLQDNMLSGFIPEELSLLTGLQSLLLFRNRKIRGPIPSEIGRLTNLMYLELGDNKLTGSIPSELGLLSNITKVGLLNNQLQGTLPTELLQLSNLENLFLSRTGLRGSLFDPADDICKSWPQLRVIMLGRNEFEGPLPTFANCSQLGAIHLDNQGFYGTIPTEWGELDKLERILLYGNEGIVGPVPSEMGLLGNLSIFKITGTNNSGIVPESLCTLPGASAKKAIEFDCSDRLCGCDCPCE